MMLERQREGIAKAKADEIRKLRAEGMGATAIEKQLEVVMASVYRVLLSEFAELSRPI